MRMTSLVLQNTDAEEEEEKEENLARQLDEIEALKSIIGEDQVRCVSADDGNLNISLLCTSPGGTLSATLKASLGPGYPSVAPPSSIYVAPCESGKNIGNGFSLFGFEGCTERFALVWADAAGAVCLYDCFVWLHERLTDLEEDNRNAVEEEAKMMEEEALMRTQALLDRQQRPSTHFGRRCIYSHHIIASSKRSAVCQTAKELGLSGISKIGWPGIIVFEGDEEACKEAVRFLTSLRWKQFVVRGEEVIKIEDGENVNSLRKFPTFSEYGAKEMKAAAAACREVGLENLFLTAMKIYK